MKAPLATAAAGLLVAVLQWMYISNLKSENADQKVKIAALNAAIDTQNHGIDKMKLTGELETSAAAERVSDVLLSGERLKATLPKGTGPKAMNEFMQAVFQ